MKMVLNKCFGGYSVSQACADALGEKSCYMVDRFDPRLIEMVERDSAWASGSCAKLKVVELPDGVTDWEINEYDGIESITYVVNGKLGHI